MGPSGDPIRLQHAKGEGPDIVIPDHRRGSSNRWPAFIKVSLLTHAHRLSPRHTRSTITVRSQPARLSHAKARRLGMRVSQGHSWVPLGHLRIFHPECLYHPN